MTVQSTSPPFVEILYWEGTSFQKLEVGDYLIGPSFGHVAIHTHMDANPKNDQYISFWPGRCGQEKSKHCQKITAHFHAYDTDCLIEKGPPKQRIPLETLDVTKINKCYEKFLKSSYSWKIFGSSPFSTPYEKNCAGLSLYLLEAGNIHVLVSNQTRKDIKSILVTLGISATIFGSLFYLFYKNLKPLLNAKKICGSCLSSYALVSNYEIQLNECLRGIRNNMKGVKFVGHHIYRRHVERDHYSHIRILENIVENIEIQSIRGVVAITLGLLGYVMLTSNKVVMQTVTPLDVKNLVSAAREQEQDKKGNPGSSGNQTALWRVAIGGAAIAFCFFIYHIHQNKEIQ